MKLHPRSGALAILALAVLPAAAYAETVTVKDITVKDATGFTMTVPSVEIVDGNLDEAAIRSLFSADYAKTISNLSTLDATSLTIPTISVLYEVPSPTDPKATTPATILWRDLVLSGVEDGVAKGGASIGSISVDGAGTSFVMGKMSASYFDLGGILSFYGLTGSKPASDEMRPIYKDFTFDGMTMTGPGLDCSIGSASASEFSARPLKHTMNELMMRTQELEAAQTAYKEPTSEQIAWLVGFYADFLTAVTSTPSTVDGMKCHVQDPTTGRPIDVTSGELTVGGFEPGIYPAIGLNDLRIAVGGEGFMEFGNFTWKKIDFNGPIKALLDVGPTIDAAWFETNWRKIIPALDGFSLADVSFDLPDESTRRPDDRIVGGIGSLDVSLSDYVNGIPTTIVTNSAGVRLTVPDSAEGAPLRALGLETLNLGYGAKLHWDEATRTIAVEDLQFFGDQIGSLKITGTIANAGPELFADNPDTATAAAMLLTVTDLKIDLVNQGIAPMIVAGAAMEQHLAPEQFYVQAAGMARALPLAMLGGTPEAVKLSTALGEFMDGRPQLTLTLKSVDPKGLGLIDLMAAQANPETLKGKFTIEATASGEKVPFVFPDLSVLSTPPTTEPPLEGPNEFPAPPTADPNLVPDAPPVMPAPDTPPAPPASERQQEKAGGKN